MKIGDKVTFLCSGQGRGGHVRVSGVITRVNRKTYNITETVGSYKPGTLWQVNKEECREYSQHYGLDRVHTEI
jgi:hypothetical protein